MKKKTKDALIVIGFCIALLIVISICAAVGFVFLKLMADPMPK